MRILHVVTAFPRGPEDVIVPWLVELIVRLRAAGHEVDVFTSAYRGGGNAEYRGIPIHRFRYAPARWEDLTHDEAAPDRMRRSLLYKLLPLPYVAGGMWAIWRLCHRKRYDVVHVHWPVPHALFGWAAGARVVTSWYGVELRWVQSSLPWLRWFVRWALRISDAVVAISSYTAGEIARFARAPVRVIPYTLGFAPAATPRLPSRDGGFRILFVGRLVERKGVTHLIEAVRRLPSDVRPHLTIIGDGPERASLEAQITRDGLGGRMTVRGRVSEAALRDAYAASDVLVLPSILDARGDTEGLGVVLMEALSYGVPVIGSDLGGITDIVRDGETGLLVPPGDPAALAAAVERLARDGGLRARLGEAGREYVATAFGWPAIMAQWEECYAAAAAAGTQTGTATPAGPTATPPRAAAR
jgi:glycosyltransferase involved in cell wall biosynthesis